MDGKMYVAGGRDPDISHSDLDTMEVFDDVTQVCSLTAQFVMIFSIYLASQLYEMSKTELGWDVHVVRWAFEANDLIPLGTRIGMPKGKRSD